MPKIKKNIVIKYIFGIIALFLIVLALKFPLRIAPERALENFKLITLQDPLFASEEFDINQIESSGKYLQKVQEIFLEEYQLKEEVVDTDFLREMIQTAKATEDFKDSPNFETAQKLLDSYKKANQVYGAEANKLYTIISKHFPKGSNQKFVTIGSSSNSDILLSDLDKIQKNSDLIDEEIKKRESILAGKKGYYSPQTQPKKPQEPLLADNFKNNIAAKTESNAVFSEGIFVLETQCFKKTGDILPFVYLDLKNNDGQAVLHPKLVNDNYFQKMMESSVSEKKFLQRGIEWHQVREGNSYRCQDLTYMADLLALRSFTIKYRDLPIFSNNSKEVATNSFRQNPLWGEAKELEKKLTTKRDFYYNADLDALGDYYEYFWHEISDKNSPLAKEMNSRFLLIKNKQVDISQVINTGFYLENLEKRLEINAITDINNFERYMYAIRSAYSFTFFNFSKSVWRASEGPQYLTGGVEGANHANYYELINKYSLEQIKAFSDISEKQILEGY